MPGLVDHPATVPSAAAIIASMMFNSIVLLPIILRATNDIENRIIIVEQKLLGLPPEIVTRRISELEKEVPAIKAMIIESTSDRYHAETAREVHGRLQIQIEALESRMRGAYSSDNDLRGQD